MMLALQVTSFIRMSASAAGAITFLFLGLSKLTSPSNLEAALISQGVFPVAAALPLAISVAVIELAAGGLCMYLLLRHGAARWVAAILALVILPMAVYASWLVAHPPPAPTSCGCGFRRDTPADWFSIALTNGSTVALFAVMAYLPPSGTGKCRHAPSGQGV